MLCHMSNNLLSFSVCPQIGILKVLSVLDPVRTNVVQFFETFTHKEKTCLVFEMLDRDLFQLYVERNSEPLSLREIRPITQQVNTAQLLINQWLQTQYTTWKDAFSHFKSAPSLIVYLTIYIVAFVSTAADCTGRPAGSWCRPLGHQAIQHNAGKTSRWAPPSKTDWFWRVVHENRKDAWARNSAFGLQVADLIFKQVCILWM